MTLPNGNHLKLFFQANQTSISNAGLGIIHLKLQLQNMYSLQPMVKIHWTRKIEQKLSAFAKYQKIDDKLALFIKKSKLESCESGTPKLIQHLLHRTNMPRESH